jgi:hypothetical protein
MIVNIYENKCPDDDKKFIIGILMQILYRVEKMTQTQQEFIAELNETKGILAKVAADTRANLARIERLEALLADADIPQEASDLLAEIKATAASIDEMTPDAPE